MTTPPSTRDEERASNSFNFEQSHYHDDTSDDDATTIGPNAPLRPPSTEFDGLRYPTASSLRERIAQQIPPSVQRVWHSTVKWVKGPQPPRIYTITPFFPKIQHMPNALLDRYAPKRIHRFGLLILLYASWLAVFSLMLWKSSAAAEIPGYGKPFRLSCAARYWGEGNRCGIDGNGCRPFANSTLAFRCPADCHKQITSHHHAVGDQDIRYKPILVGGPTESHTGFEDSILNNAIYRSDSFICASAVHAGFISDTTGGCGVLTLTGEQPSFTGSTHHGLTSLGFDSYFPHTFAFLKSTTTNCPDLRWPALAPTLTFTILLSLFTTSPSIHFWSIFPALFFHVALISDPPSQTTFPSLLSKALGRFLPACFCAWVTYKYTIHRSLQNLTAQFEKTILWVGAAWIGALNNYTFDRIPIQRLTAHDLRAQPGAIPALIIIVGGIFTIALGQAWAFRVEGRMPRYLAIYGIFVGSICFMVMLPGLNLRIHHYILGLVLLPGTAFQNRPSLVYQGLLVGLFVNGVARWGFASILETDGALLQGDHKGSALPQVEVLRAGMGNISFGFGEVPLWDEKKKGVRYDGVSVLVNDVERFRGFGGEGRNGALEWLWERHVVGDVEGRVLPEYFRFAYMSGSAVWDYTKAGKWDVEGRWIEMQDGASR
ncbi:related to LCCL domain protein [Ramularia collo-cygni]|uniref:Related to LCCL domain protein n=1 Tax=Ramularia collo-cygni TaxID=112498 RepID=A0A2D3VA46_9PEZI|nr:related to LCCL domain protein [Ramularia collo-cygni]CZT21647.1 related to LCCL domain protein [Ramularia collo-cygni]